MYTLDLHYHCTSAPCAAPIAVKDVTFSFLCNCSRHPCLGILRPLATTHEGSYASPFLFLYGLTHMNRDSPSLELS